MSKQKGNKDINLFISSSARVYSFSKFIYFMPNQ